MTRKRRQTSLGEILGLSLFLVFTAAALIMFVRFNRSTDDTRVEQPLALASPIATTTSSLSTPAADTVNVFSDSDMAIMNARIQIPAAGINAPVIAVYLNGESWDVNNLGMNVGHLQGTSWMSRQPGNIVLSGHVELRDGRKGIFANLTSLEAGDLIVLQHGDEERRYMVAEISTVNPDDLRPVFPTTDDRLTLITCDSFDFFSNSYLERLIVVAERIS